MNNKALLIFAIMILAVAGCGFKTNIESMGINKMNMAVVVPGERGFKTVVIKDVVRSWENEKGVDDLPDDVKEIEVRLKESVDFAALAGLLEDKKINIVTVPDEKDVKFLISKYKGSLKDLLRNVEDSAGVEFIYKNGSLIARKNKKALVKVLSSGGEKVVGGVLKAYGVSDYYYDQGKGMVIFNSDVITYRKIKAYFDAMPLYVATVSIALIESEISKDEKVGIDWQQFASSINFKGGLGEIIKFSGASSGAFAFSAAGDMVNLSGVLNSLESFRKYEVIQNSSVSIVSGENGVIDVSDKVPFVSEIGISGVTVPVSSGGAVNSTTGVTGTGQGIVTGAGSNINGGAPGELSRGTLTENGSVTAAANQVMQSTKFGEVSSGLVIDLTPIVNHKMVRIAVDIKYNAVKEFIEVGSKDQMILRPVVSSKSIVTNVVIVPGDLVSVGSMRYTREFKSRAGLWSLANYGKKESESKYYEIIALMSCQVIEYRSDHEKN